MSRSPFPAVLVAALLAFGCSAPALPSRYQQAQRLELKGDLKGALRIYNGVWQKAKKASVRALAGVRRAKILLDLGRAREAVEGYLAVERGPGSRKRIGARALYRAACIIADRLGEIERALGLFKQVVDRYPDHVAADDALQRIVRIYRGRRRINALLIYLRDRYRVHRYRDVADNLLFLAAQVFEKDVKDLNSSVSMYERVVRHDSRGPLVDDANFHAARLYRRLGKPMKAIVCYHRILSTKTDAWVVGSWNSVYLDDAQFQTGMTYLEDIRDLDKAVDAFRTLVKEFDTSTLRDDALWWIALTELRRGRTDAALSAHAEIREKFPDSRFVRERKALEDWAQAASALARKNRKGVCAAIRRHARAYPRTWFRKRRGELRKRFRCAAVVGGGERG